MKSTSRNLFFVILMLGLLAIAIANTTLDPSTTTTTTKASGDSNNSTSDKTNGSPSLYLSYCLLMITLCAAVFRTTN
ncbi:hypothetical protein Bpfe_004270 [Biomphalaria pfeifferi]|uniref:Uncharacterized protein n=1 Tax=Biomphalaria pfeifferi TaxID=112525 RepID=A0AAD8C478_BIOPF|nr:hypothetical protein Bpfe_004270 [Biomphalaria pfeifferi]